MMAFASEPAPAVRGGGYRHTKQHASASAAEMDSLSNAVVTWLHFLQMEQYAADFLDNGYDDLETVKRMGVADLLAVGVTSPHDQAFLLDAVRVLREQGGVWVYLLHASSASNASSNATGSDYDSASGSSGLASGNSSLAVASIDSSSGGSNSLRMNNKAGSNTNTPQLGATHASRTKAQQQADSILQQQMEQDLICSVAQMSMRNNAGSQSQSQSQSPATKAKLWNKQKKASNGKRQQPKNFDHAREMRVSDDFSVSSSFDMMYVDDHGHDPGHVRATSRMNHTYLNINTVREARSGFAPGKYASSSCLSDREEEDLYDLATNYQTNGRAAKAKMASAGLYHMAKNMLSSSRVSSPFRRPAPHTNTYTSSLRRGNSLTDDDASLSAARFSTRTRLRPGGPAPHSRATSAFATGTTARPRYSSADPQAVYGTPTMASTRRNFSEMDADGGAWQVTGGCATPLVLARSSRPMPRSTVVYAHARQGRSCIEEASV